MLTKKFDEKELKKLFKPAGDSSKEDNGKVTIIGGSWLFHGAPILALKTASRIVDMVFFSSPEPSIGEVAKKIKSQLGAFIWVPFEEVGEYIQKSDAVLIGPGFMRYRKESQNLFCKQKKLCDKEGYKTKRITEALLRQFPQKQWVIDAGSLQVMSAEFIPRNAILTPNKKEFEMLFKSKIAIENSKLIEFLKENSQKYNCIIVLKLVQTIVCSPEKLVLVEGGNAGLTKGGTGDVLAGLTVGLAAKNEPFLAASAASFILKKTADYLYKKVGFAYNADDLAEKIPEVLGKYLSL
jgi:NAD(P)H-hydrate epimerase